MAGLKIIATILSIAIASLAYILLTRYFPSEEIFFMGSQSLTRVLAVDMKVKSNKNFPTFLPENVGFIVIHVNQSPADHRNDILETRRILPVVTKTKQNIVRDSDALYAHMEILFLKHALVGLSADYMTLASLGIKSIDFNADYLPHFADLYQDKLPHAAGYITMADGSQRLIHDILVK